MAYFKASKGFRLGGASGLVGPIPVVAASDTNPVLASAVANECALQAKILLATACNPGMLLKAPKTYSSDWVWSYEVGEKSSFFHHRMIADVDAYWEHWDNPQVITNLAGYGLAVNGGDARIKGIEIQLEALLPLGFDLALNGGYTDAQFIQSSALTGFPEGAQIRDTPKASASAVLQWEHPMADGLSFFGSFEDDYVATRTDLPIGETATLQNINQILVHMPAYSVANLRLGVRDERNAGGRWAITVFIDNVANNQALLDPQPQITLQTSAFARYVISRPLTAGIDVSYQFR